MVVVEELKDKVRERTSRRKIYLCGWLRVSLACKRSIIFVDPLFTHFYPHFYPKKTAFKPEHR